MQNNHLIFIIVALLTFLLTTLIEVKLIPKLRGKASQPIYLDGPRWHATKEGTPTMGGLAFLIAITVLLSLSSAYLFLRGRSRSAVSLILCLLYGVANSLIGIIDDRTKLKRKRNAGLSPIEKLLLQSLAAVLFIIARVLLLGKAEVIIFGFGRFDLGILYYPLAFLALIGTVNAANLTDGIDGLASCVAFAIAVAMTYISFGTNDEVLLISAALIGATVAFLIFNLHPAKIFMGDTGSLLLGALISASAVTLGNPLLILFLGGVYLIEALSVMIQVVCFKLTGKRVFKMAPVHHHLEKCGMSENTICILGIIVTLILSIPAVMLYKQ